jgi:hypothetical protein
MALRFKDVIARSGNWIGLRGQLFLETQGLML